MSPSEFLRSKKLLPTDLRTKQLSRLPLWIKEQSFFMAGVTDAVLLESFRDAAQAVVDGRLSEAEATQGIREALAATGYQPGDGQEGTIKDVSTLRRQMLSLRTAVALAQGYGAEAKQWKAAAVFPAKELYRAAGAKIPRQWARLWPEAAKARNASMPDALPLRDDLMMAPMGDPIWVMLSDFGAPYDPLKYGSKMRQRPVGRRAAIAAGIVSENAEARTPKPEGKPNAESPAPEAPKVASAAPEPVIPSPGAELEVKPGLPEAARARVERDLKGLARWEGDSLIFTDPNGTRPSTPEALAPVIAGPNVDGTANFQRLALAEWQALGGDENALAEMRRKHAGEDMLDDFNRLADRLQRGSPGVRLVDLLAGLAGFLATLLG